MLIEDGLITAIQRDEALRVQKSNGARLGTNLVQLGAIELEALALALSRHKGVPAAQQRHFDSIHPEVVALLPARLAQKHAAIPLGFTARHPKTVGIAFLDPQKPGAVDEIQRAAGVRVYPVIAPELRIVQYLEKLYGIPRHPRFLHLDGDGDGPERRPRGAGVGDPRSFFDMSRPDLSQPRTASAILLTEELRVPDAKAPSAQRSSPGGPTKTPPVLSPHPPASPSRAPAARGTPTQFARPPLNTPPTIAPAAPSWPPVPLEATPPVVGSQAPKSSASAKPAPVAEKRPEAHHPRGEASEASSRAPTIPGLPSFSDTDLLGIADQASAAPTEKIEPSVVASPPDTSFTAESADSPSAGEADVSIWSPNWRVTQASQSASSSDRAGSPLVHLDLDTALRAAPLDLDLDLESAVSLEAAEPSEPPAASSYATQQVSAPATPRPWSAAEAVDAIAVARNRDQIAEAVVNYLRSSCGVGLVLIVQHEVAMGWKGFGPGISDEEIDALAIPLAAPSVLQNAYQEQQTYRGPPSHEPTALDLQLFERLRVAPPQEVVVAPVLIRDRVVNLILGQAEDGGALPDRMSIGLGTLTRSAGAAYVRLIQEAKKRAPS